MNAEDATWLHENATIASNRTAFSYDEWRTALTPFASRFDRDEMLTNIWVVAATTGYDPEMASVLLEEQMRAEAAEEADEFAGMLLRYLVIGLVILAIGVAVWFKAEGLF